MKRKYIIPLVLVCLALWAGSSWSLSLEVPAAQVAMIRPSEKSADTRLLVSFALPESLQGKSIDFACVSFEADCAGDEGGVSFQGYALTKAWDTKSVSWSGSWDAPGGDWNRKLSAYGISEAGSGKTVELDVTEFARGWLAEPSSNFGVIVKVSGPFIGTFSIDNAQEVPKLRILFSEI